MKLLNPKKRRLFAIIVVSILIVLGWINFNGNEDYLDKMLQNNNVSETISISGVQYQIKRGSTYRIDGEKIDGGEKQKAKEIALLIAEARLSPLLAIVGTDPSELRQEVDRLKITVEDLANLQNNINDSKYVSESLYPIQFLYSLADLEEARLELLSFKNRENANQYEKSLFRAITVGVEQSKAFSDAIDYMSEHYVGPKQLYVLSGTISTGSILGATKNIETRFEEVERIARRRQKCRTGKITDEPCAISILRKNISENLSSESSQTKVIPGYLEEVHHLYATVFHRVYGSDIESELDKPKLVISNSVCVKELEPPYFFSGGNYISNAFFFSTSQDAPVLNYLKENNISHVMIYPTFFYLCPESQHDRGMLAALENTRSLARKYPAIAENEHNLLLEGDVAVRESAARLYLSAAIDELNKNDDRKTLIRFEETSLMIQGRSANLDLLISEINTVNLSRIANHKKGIPYDVSAPFMFLTHSAFPSLFLAHNPGAGETSVKITEYIPGNLEEFFEAHRPYGEIIKKVKLDELTEDLVQMLRTDINQ